MSTRAPVAGFERVGAAPSQKQLFEQVSASCSGLISRIALACEPDEALRKILIQDILLAVWVALASFRGDCSFRIFVAGIAHRRAISHMTRHPRAPGRAGLSANLMPPSLAPNGAAMSNDKKQHVVNAIQQLPIPLREVIVLCFEGFSDAEIGQALGLSEAAAIARCRRARSALRMTAEQGR
ncbi:MAG TPA: sigma-70 family RNA polymerase sigma factor [Allosphingosinicella sp.]|nr:sigma-70 family RNA polymerase sigma factor [Allosphingosinicella sp.]